MNLPCKEAIYYLGEKRANLMGTKLLSTFNIPLMTEMHFEFELQLDLHSFHLGNHWIFVSLRVPDPEIEQTTITGTSVKYVRVSLFGEENKRKGEVS